MKAAATLCVRQPAVSKTLRELEGLLGGALFVWRGRGVLLTRFGKVFVVGGGRADLDLMTSLSFGHLYSERVSLVVRPGHPLLDLKPFDLAKLTNYTVLEQFSL